MEKNEEDEDGGGCGVHDYIPSENEDCRLVALGELRACLSCK